MHVETDLGPRHPSAPSESPTHAPSSHGAASSRAHGPTTPGRADTDGTGPLNQIERLLSDGNPNNDGAVCDKLDSFEQSLADHVAEGSLTDEQAAQLAAYAEALSTSLGCG